MSVLFVIPHLSNGGAERDVINLANGLVDAGVEVGVMTYIAGGDYEKDLHPSVRRHCVGHRVKTAVEHIDAVGHLVRVGWSYSAVVSVLELFTDELVIQANAIWSALGRRKRVVGVVHITLSQYDLYTSRKRNQTMVSRVYPCFDQLIAVSEGVKSDLVDILGDKCPPIDAVFNPIDSDAIRQACHQPLDITHIQPYFVSVGRLGTQKDYPTLISAFHELTQSGYSHYHLVILGRGELEQELCALCDELGVPNVHFVGFAQNPWAYMRQAAGLVLSSRYEGMSLVIAEAMCCGTPVISTDCPHGPAELLERGKNGYLVPVGDSSALAQAMRRVIENPADAQLKAASALSSIGRFDARHVVRRYRELIEG